MQHAYKGVSGSVFCNEIVAKRSSPRCGGAIGVYFLVKRCSLLYLYAGNGTFAQSPYLDVHGEVDVSMRFVMIALSDERQLMYTTFPVDEADANTFTTPDGRKSERFG